MAIVRNYWFLVAAAGLGLVLTVAQSADAQQRRGRGLFGVSRVQLATLEKVQAELKMTDAQKKSATEINEQFTADRRELFQGGGAGGDFAEMREKLQKLTTEATDKLVASLDDAQKKRLTEIFIQINGGGALSDPAVAKELKITEQQTDELNRVREQNFTAIREAIQDSQGASAEERQETLTKVRTQGEEKLMAVLTADQREQMTKLKGQEIELDLTPLFPQRGNN